MSTFHPGRIAAALVAIGGIAAPVSAQETLRVPQDFATIQAAVDAAENGDTIQISKGEYPEYVEITGFSGLTLLGKGKPALLGTGVITDGEELESGGLSISGCDNVPVKGLVARDTVDANGFAVFSSSNVTLQLCRVEQPVSDDGIGIFSSSDVTIDRCRVEGTPLGPVDGGEPVGGINISSSTGVSVLKAKIQDVSDDGIHVASSGDVLIQKCKLQRIGDDGIHGSSGGTGGLITVDRCKLKDIGQDGIETSGGMTDLHVIKTRIQLTGDDGVNASGRAATLEKVSVTDADGNAFKFSPIAGPVDGGGIDGPILVTNCRAAKIDDDGLDLDANGAVVENLKLKQIEDDGVRVADCDGVSITKVRMSKVDGKGMQIFGVEDSDFLDFRMAKPNDGVYVDFASTGNLFQDWKITAPDGEGFDLDGPSNTFIDNKVSKAGGYGFSVITGGNTFTGNKATGSGNADLQDTAGKGANTYTDNTFGTSEGP